MRAVKPHTTLCPVVLALAATVLAAVAPASRAQAPPRASLKVALTFDDLPVHATLPPGTRRLDVAKAIVSALAAHHAPPTYGFVNGQGLRERAGNVDVLRLWRASGHLLGNHTWSHKDLDASTLDAFEQDVIANEPILDELMGTADWRWLRFPYLHEGNTAVKRDAVALFLHARGYRVAPATITFGDWGYNDPYARCVAADDRAAIDWMRTRFLERANDAIVAAAALRGPRVVLMHFGAFDALMLPAFLELLDQRAVVLVTLADEVAAATPGAKAAAASPAAAADSAGADDTMSRLDRLCR